MSSDLYTTHGYAMLGVLGIAIIITLARLARGPTLADRVVAVDTIGMIGVAISCAAAFAYGRPWPLDAALVLALVSFLSTAALARYIGLEQERHEQ